MNRNGLIEFDAVVAIARRASFRAAALDLGLSTTALSNRIARLEKELGVRLFNRTTRSVSLTEAGRSFVGKVGPALRDIHDAMDDARSRQETPSGTLRINAFTTAAREIMGPIVLSYLRRYPQVSIDLVTEGQLIDIVADGFDLGVRSRDLVPSDMIAVPVGQRRSFAVVGTADYFAARGLPLTPLDLLQHSCIRVRLPSGSLYRWHFEKDGKALQLDVNGRLTLDEGTLARTAVLDSFGIGFFMESEVREDIAAGRLVRVLEDWTPPLAPLCLYYPARRNAPAAFSALIEHARAFTAGE